MSTRKLERVALETSKHNRNGGMTEPPYSRNPVENECIKCCGVFQRGKKSNNT